MRHNALILTSKTKGEKNNKSIIKKIRYDLGTFRRKSRKKWLWW